MVKSSIKVTWGNVCQTITLHVYAHKFCILTFTFSLLDWRYSFFDSPLFPLITILTSFFLNFATSLGRKAFLQHISSVLPCYNMGCKRFKIWSLPKTRSVSCLQWSWASYSFPNKSSEAPGPFLIVLLFLLPVILSPNLSV